VLNYKDVGALLAVQVTISDGSGASLKGSQIRDLCPACKDSLVAFLEGAAVKVIR
jgi:hypothetical protein